MNKKIRALAKQYIPKPLSIRAWNLYSQIKARQAKAAFTQASETPSYLQQTDLIQLQKAYPPVRLDYLYDKSTLVERGQKRAQEIYKLLAKDWSRLNRFLDLGAWDAMTCAALQTMGKQTVGIDIRTEGFTKQAAAQGVTFLQMDAAQLGLTADYFDCVFSFNCFEHFPNPEHVLREALRVTKPGGYIYLDFGPLYWSEKGAHQFNTIHVPYNQCLFSKKQLTTYAQTHNIELMGFFWMNEWNVEQYRQLWNSYSDQLETVIYYETLNADHVNLITHYPSCFKSKSKNFEDFLVAYIEVLFRKIA